MQKGITIIFLSYVFQFLSITIITNVSACPEMRLGGGGDLLIYLLMMCWLCVHSHLCVIALAYLCKWVMSCIHAEGAGSSLRLSSEGRRSTAAFSSQGSTGSSAAGTQCCTYIYSAVRTCQSLQISYICNMNGIVTESETLRGFQPQRYMVDILMEIPVL